MAKKTHPQKNDHHILPKSRGGEKNKLNLKRTPFNYHTAYHVLFDNLTPEEIIRYLQEVWFTPNKSFIKPFDWLERQAN